MTGQYITKKTFDNLTEDILASNIENCIFNNVENIKFERCNIENCTFNSVTTFDRCSLIKCNIVNNSTLINSAISDGEDDEELML